MSDPTQTLVERILAIRRGDLPDDAVTVEELRAAVEQQRQKFKQMATGEMAAAASAKATSKKPSIDFGNITF